MVTLNRPLPLHSVFLPYRNHCDCIEITEIHLFNQAINYSFIHLLNKLCSLSAMILPVG